MRRVREDSLPTTGSTARSVRSGSDVSPAAWARLTTYEPPLIEPVSVISRTQPRGGSPDCVSRMSSTAPSADAAAIHAASAESGARMARRGGSSE